MGASSTGVSCDISGILICRVGLVLNVQKNLGHFDLALVSGIFFSCVGARELVPSSVSVRKSVRILHWNNQASLRLRCVRDLHYYFLLPCTCLYVGSNVTIFLGFVYEASPFCTIVLHFRNIGCTDLMFPGPDF
jgi:hypothetical protein